MSASRIISASLPSLCQKLLKLVEIWRSSDKNNFAQFLRHGVRHRKPQYRLWRHAVINDAHRIMLQKGPLRLFRWCRRMFSTCISKAPQAASYANAHCCWLIENYTQVINVTVSDEQRRPQKSFQAHLDDAIRCRLPIVTYGFSNQEHTAGKSDKRLLI